MSDSAIALIASTLARNPDLDRLPPRGFRRVDTGLWRCADGRYVCTTDMEPRYWARFCEAVGRPDYAAQQFDAGRREAITADLKAILLTRTSAQWMTVFDAAGTQAMPVYDIAEALDDAHNLSRGAVITVTTPDGEALHQIGCPIKLSDTPARVRRLAGLPGEDEADILDG